MGPLENRPVAAAFATLATPGLPGWAGQIKECLDKAAADPTSRYAQLASVCAQGRPHVRTVVMRGCLAELGETNETKTAGRLHFWLITDRRSAKFQEIQHASAIEIAWYFSASRTQFRLAGEALYFDQADCEIRRAAWSKLSIPARVQFYWPEPLKPRDPFGESQFQVHENADHFADPPENFVVLAIDVYSVDQLELNGNPQDRFISSRDENGHWSHVEVNP